MNSTTRTRGAALALLLSIGPGLSTAAAVAPQLPADFDAWLSHQTNLMTWSADVIQTRTLKALTQPLTTTGRVWFQAPYLFRWELGQPPRTIATRQSDRLVLLYPGLKRAEIYALGAGAQGPWRDSLSLIEAGFPRSRDDLLSRFEILTITPQASTLVIDLQPRAASARRWMPHIQVTLNVSDHSLKATELSFADGSRLRNEFTNALVNPPVDGALFAPPVPQDYKVTESPGR